MGRTAAARGKVDAGVMAATGLRRGAVAAGSRGKKTVTWVGVGEVGNGQTGSGGLRANT